MFDSEAVKTVGLVNRLLAEQGHPQCDVFWNNEELRTRLLAAKGMFRETNGWTVMGYRTRRMVVNTNLLSLAKAPQHFSDATNAAWHGKVALAYPLFRHDGDAFPGVAPEMWGEAKWQGMVPGAGGEQAIARGWQFRGGRNWWAMGSNHWLH